MSVIVSAIFFLAFSQRSEGNPYGPAGGYGTPNSGGYGAPNQNWGSPPTFGIDPYGDTRLYGVNYDNYSANPSCPWPEYQQQYQPAPPAYPPQAPAPYAPHGQPPHGQQQYAQPPYSHPPPSTIPVYGNDQMGYQKFDATGGVPVDARSLDNLILAVSSGLGAHLPDGSKIDSEMRILTTNYRAETDPNQIVAHMDKLMNQLRDQLHKGANRESVDVLILGAQIFYLATLLNPAKKPPGPVKDASTNHANNQLRRLTELEALVSGNRDLCGNAKLHILLNLAWDSLSGRAEMNGQYFLGLLNLYMASEPGKKDHTIATFMHLATTAAGNGMYSGNNVWTPPTGPTWQGRPNTGFNVQGYPPPQNPSHGQQGQSGYPLPGQGQDLSLNSAYAYMRY